MKASEVGSIRVVGKLYEVVLVEAMDDKLGEHDPTKQTITLVADQHPEAMQDTLLHEVVHAVSDAMEINLRERQVAAIAAGLLQVFRDNHEFSRFITTRPKRK